MPPLGHVRVTTPLEAIEQARTGSMAGFEGCTSKGQRDHECAVAGRKIDLTDEGDIPVLGAVVGPRKATVP